MAWRVFGRKRTVAAGASVAVRAEDQLRRRIQRCVDTEDASQALGTAALAEVSAVLDDVAAAAVGDGSSLDARAINDVALLHRLRVIGLHGSFEDRHACGAAQVLAHAIEPAAVPPDVRDEVAEAVSHGAPTDLPTAVLRVLQGNASAVRAAWRRQPDPQLADLLVHAFQRLIEMSDPISPAHPTRLLDLAATLSGRYDYLRPGGDLADLDEAIRITDEVIAASTDDAALLIRAHKLRGPMLADRDETNPGSTDLAEAVVSFRALVDLTDPADPQHADLVRRLSHAQVLLSELS
ncbi:hypothetical protein ABZS66_22620 [Dactylosporangium sp. NPDC005572]|uniref:hypothetical protein n=1 Tax=Dactylosporangium sp. NPDC005572 TaxID=3156889 RepID=UPI0033B0FC1F